MEYMAYAKPIVTFDLKETRFSAGEAAIYVEPNKEAEFAEAIAQLMEQPELQKKMGAFGRRRVEDELQWARVGKNLLTAYETLLVEK
jgi:glycosyltransferase involved in cell wall biosynthesis